MIRALLALVLLLPFAPQTSEAFVFRKIVYCSPIEGLVHWAGKPLENVVATRELYSGGFDGGKYSDTATTNAQGQFKFAVVEERRFLRPDLLSANPVVSQTIKVFHNGVTYLIWYFRKPNFELGTESTTGNLQLDCDLSISEMGGESRIVRCKNNGIQQQWN
ncbi:DUF6795 domain-containing protein [Limnobacter sp.]|uniref:DUF6795 domain-containing protein n=1 Tax=Limnobacter sp. TaxID=2003368 RepID=UPI0032EED134